MLHKLPCRNTLPFLARLALASLLLSATSPAAQAAKDEEDSGPDEQVLTTKDGLDLHVSYYEGTEGKETVPVIILHDFEETRHEYASLAETLQAQGHAVAVPDLRGHGDSQTMRHPVTGQERKITTATLKKNDMVMMYARGGDLETLKSFLVKENNRGKLNVNALCVVGVGMGSMLAINWSIVDWSWPPLATGKQGQDVKALVLISPVRNFRGVPIQQSLQMEGIQRQISKLIMVGEGREAREAELIYKKLEQYATVLGDNPTKEQIAEKKDLFYVEFDTKLQGLQLIKSTLGRQIAGNIVQFIHLRMVEKEFPWDSR